MISDFLLVIKFRQLLFSKHKVTIVIVWHVVLYVNANTFISDCAWTFSLRCPSICKYCRCGNRYENVFVLLISLCVHLVDCVFYMCTIGINSADNLANYGVHLLSSWLRYFSPIFETSSFLWDWNLVCMSCYISWGLYNSLDVLYRNWMVKRIFCGWSGLGKGFLGNQEIRLKDPYNLRKSIQCQFLRMCSRRLISFTKDF